jgi:hypothetical protein
LADTAIAITAGTGTNVDTRTEATNGNHRQVIVIGDPSTNAGVAPVDATTGLAVNVTNASLTVASHAVTNAGTFAVQAAATLAAETTKVIGTVNVAAAQTLATVTTVGAVTAITNALPAGTNAIGKLAANSGVDIGDVDVTTIAGVAPAFGDGAKGATVLRTTLATDSAGIIATGTQGSPSAAYVSTVAAGDIAHDAVDSGNPQKIGGVARSSEPTAVATADRVQAMFDLVGKLIVLPYANPENFVSGAITSAMTGTTSTSLVAAPAAGLRNYLTQITVSNSHATVGTDIVIQDGSGGTTLYTIPAAAVYGGAVITFPTPLRQPTTATAIFCANVTTGASTKVSASGYKGA